MDKIIAEFLENKKQAYIKKKLSANSSDTDKLIFKQDVNDKYSLKNWLIDASNRASQLSITSHPAKFIHPNAKATSIIEDCPQKNDGLLRSGNVQVDLDIFGNAAALDVEKFLRLKPQDAKKTILQHLEEETDFIKQQFEMNEISFTSIRNGFLKIKQSDLKQTSEKLKQVYFPVKNNYHLLSVLIPSGIIYKLKQRINEIRFSDENKRVREELKKSSPESLKGKIEDIFNLTVIGYGGTKPQNISTLNNQNGGKSFLLSSMPPQFEKRKIQPPKIDFFDNCLWGKLFKSEFEEFHKVLAWRKNNIEARDKRDAVVIDSIAKIQRILNNIREIDKGWSDSNTYTKLPKWQKIWLDDKYQDIRNNDKQNNQYMEKAQSRFSNWFIGNYKSIQDSKTLGDEDIDRIKLILSQEQELLK